MSQTTKVDPRLAIGQLGGLCNRRACRRPGATWYNSGSYAYYCGGCAAIINDANPGREPLCKNHLGRFGLTPTVEDSLKSCLNCTTELPEGTTRTLCEECIEQDDENTVRLDEGQ